MKLIVKSKWILICFIMLISCSNEKVEEGESLEVIEPELFGEQFLDGKFESIYYQTNEAFQLAVTLEQFLELGASFNEGVASYEQLSQLATQGMDEYLWVSEEGDKGIRVYYGDDMTIEGIQLTPITIGIDDDENYTENIYEMPINEEMYVFWGGLNELQNYHYALDVQRYAYDLIQVEGDQSFEGEGIENEDYFIFGKEVVAPLSGKVVSVENRVHDNVPNTEMNTEMPLGNHVVIKHENDEYSVLAHIKQGSIVVAVGDEVEAGERLGLVGNSGNSSEPHIHYHVADSENWLEASSLRIRLEGEKDPVRGETVSGF
ncbi:M23 family metallopeptidase [Alkalihalobacillus sp. 1P02AB]|uniref:M23 family metallopeptidase n=1 Tax=Alkalihalobacillus sp. 1P02AB TaxID=3132260 RepID=UPI0039A68218